MANSVPACGCWESQQLFAQVWATWGTALLPLPPITAGPQRCSCLSRSRSDPCLVPFTLSGGKGVIQERCNARKQLLPLSSPNLQVKFVNDVSKSTRAAAGGSDMLWLFNLTSQHGRVAGTTPRYQLRLAAHRLRESLFCGIPVFPARQRRESLMITTSGLCGGAAGWCGLPGRGAIPWALGLLCAPGPRI